MFHHLNRNLNQKNCRNDFHYFEFFSVFLMRIAYSTQIRATGSVKKKDFNRRREIGEYGMAIAEEHGKRPAILFSMDSM